MTRNVRITLIALSVMFLIACCTLSWGAASAIFPPPGLPVAAASTAPSGSSTFSAAAIDQSTAAPGGDATPTASGGNSSPTPSDSATVTPTPSPPAATPTPTLTPTPSINPCANPYCNPWGYNFMPGSLIPNPNLAFCSVFPCVSKFWSQRGYVVECTNGLFAHDGGSLTVCGKPSNYLRTLFQHP